ncbi:MAG: cellulose biosynthesis protein BcsG [Limnobacter sp.]|nr:cellulose biosynthesis protein BcsG [Limnobacter sp.]
MLLWNLYFLTVLGLSHIGKASFEPLANLALLALVFVFYVLHFVKPRLSTALQILTGTPLAVALLLHQLGLILSKELLTQIQNLLGLNPHYLLELLRRSVPAQYLWAALATYIVLRIVNRYIRVHAWVATAVALFALHTLWADHLVEKRNAKLALMENANSKTLRAGGFETERIVLGETRFEQLKITFNQGTNTAGKQSVQGMVTTYFEKQRKLALDTFTPLAQPDFDIVLIHVCSLAWADLKGMRQTQHPLLRDADLLFSEFNTATSYSGPAVVRLLRSTCGQPTHTDLYTPPRAECALFNQLERAGFRVEFGLNHDGKFDGFKQQVQTNLMVPAQEPVTFDSVSLGAIAFDQSPIARDLDFLKAWLKHRNTESGKPVAYYYNTITLHDGNLLPNSSLNSLEAYPVRLERFLDDLQGFVQAYRKSGRKALVLMVPEHGAGMTGEYGQLTGLREIPTPAITKAPVLGYWISPNFERKDVYKFPVTIEKPVSYLAVSEFIARWIELPPSQRDDPTWPLLVSDLPTSLYVAEQGRIAVTEINGNYLLKTPGARQWVPLDKQ